MKYPHLPMMDINLRCCDVQRHLHRSSGQPGAPYDAARFYEQIHSGGCDDTKSHCRSLQQHVLNCTFERRPRKLSGYDGLALGGTGIWCEPSLRACLSKQFQWVDRIGWARGAHRLCADRHLASTEQVLFGSGPPPRAGWILRHWCNSLKSITQTGSE
jgi:hypothetical protein